MSFSSNAAARPGKVAVAFVSMRPSRSASSNGPHRRAWRGHPLRSSIRRSGRRCAGAEARRALLGARSWMPSTPAGRRLLRSSSLAPAYVACDAPSDREGAPVRQRGHPTQCGGFWSTRCQGARDGRPSSDQWTCRDGRGQFVRPRAWWPSTSSTQPAKTSGSPRQIQRPSATSTRSSQRLGP